jgi:hypothetical protein
MAEGHHRDLGEVAGHLQNREAAASPEAHLDG